MSALDGVQYKHKSKTANFGSTLKHNFNENNKIFQPYFKPKVKTDLSKESENVLQTKNPERKIDQILHDVKESKQLETSTENKNPSIPATLPVKRKKRKEESKNQTTVKGKNSSKTSKKKRR